MCEVTQKTLELRIAKLKNYKKVFFSRVNRISKLKFYTA